MSDWRNKAKSFFSGLWSNGRFHYRVYLDYASATPVLPEAQKAVTEAWAKFGNPGAIHADGVEAEKLLARARERIARELACKPREIIFTSGGTEGNNLAILGVARNLARRRLAKQGDALLDTHWIVSSIEHPSVLECFSEIERLGGKVSHVDPDERGVIKPEAVVRALKPQTKLISIGWANHEIGVVQPIRDIARAIHSHDGDTISIIFHSDAGQAPLYLSPQVHTLGVDLMTLDSGKLYGSRGVGALYISNRVELAPIILGGGQERGLRAGTENVALAAGFAEAFGVVARGRQDEARRLKKLRDDFARDIVARIPQAVINGDLKRSLPHMLNISIPEIQSEYVTLALDAKGISISTKSACREGESRRSHVVAALIPHFSKKVGDGGWRAENTLRFSFGRYTSEHDLGYALAALQKVIKSGSF
ncbi:MAG: cysteine desulfurase family protein [Patescibacteria group bacterium]